MSRSKVVAGVSGTVAALSVVAWVVLANQSQTFGADPTSPPAQFAWLDIVKMLFAGSTVSAISSIWNVIRPYVRSVTPDAIPLPPADIESKVEFIAAAVAYYKSPEDKACQLRFSMSSLTEIGNIEAMKSGDVPARLRDLTAAIVAQQFPVTE